MCTRKYSESNLDSIAILDRKYNPSCMCICITSELGNSCQRLQERDPSSDSRGMVRETGLEVETTSCASDKPKTEETLTGMTYSAYPRISNPHALTLFQSSAGFLHTSKNAAQSSKVREKEERRELRSIECMHVVCDKFIIMHGCTGGMNMEINFNAM
ncbi:hypothetical protein BDY19DRAFT_904546 [Irpex rosettiformis]|uniref:Uncharacterized protein n=1 Tax=Irpex rosettiformis TaxID=378272 RepID=A0ACB8U9W4_9APHY|nr:hypothetical protein BDY19DRAFT_904546 [Irpex rosettiformis]